MIVVALEDPTSKRPDGGWHPVVGDLFSPLDVLAPATRLELSGHVAVPGRSPAIDPAALAEQPLPATPDALAAIGAAIAAGLGAADVAALGDRRFDDVVPALRRVDAARVRRAVPQRLRSIVAPDGAVADVRHLTVGQVAQARGVGTRRIAALLASMVGAAVDVVAATLGRERRATASLDDLAAVLAHDASGSASVRRALAAIAADGPPTVQAAAERLLRLGQEDVRLRRLDEALRAAGDVRDRAVFEHVVLGPGQARRGEVAAALGIGVERVRQLGARAAERVEEALDGAAADLAAAGAELARLIGAAAPLPAVDAALASVALPALPDARSRLLLRLAGPYQRVERHPGWVALDPGELLGESRRALIEDGGVRPVDDVIDELAALGVRDEHAKAWIAVQPVRVTEGLVVATSGSPGDVAERALHATGRAMTTGELAEWLPAAYAGAVTQWWSDRRFVPMPEGALALREWGLHTGADGASGGTATAGAAGRTGGTSGPAAAGEAGEAAPTLRIVVDQSVLAGSTGPVPRALVGALGLRPGAHRTIATRYGPVAVIHDGDTPARGSLRPIALAVGATLGDELTIAIHPDGRDATVTVARPAGAGGVPPTDRKDHR